MMGTGQEDEGATEVLRMARVWCRVRQGRLSLSARPYGPASGNWFDPRHNGASWRVTSGSSTRSRLLSGEVLSADSRADRWSVEA